MTSEAKTLLIIAAVTVILLAGGVFFLSAKQPPNPTNESNQTTYQIDYSKGEKIGTDSAKIKLVEFSDLQCPACKSYEVVLRQIRQKYQNNPDFQFIYRHYPLYPMPHKFALMAAEAVEEANTEGKFWEYHDLLFTTQEQWSLKDDPTEDFANLARQVGVDGDKVKGAIKTNKYDAKIQADISEGKSLGINSTPTFFLKGKKMVLDSVSDLSLQVDQALK